VFEVERKALASNQIRGIPTRQGEEKIGAIELAGQKQDQRPTDIPCSEHTVTTQ